MNKIKINGAFVLKDDYDSEAPENMNSDFCYKDSKLKKSDKNTCITPEANFIVLRPSLQQSFAPPEMTDWDLNKLIDYIGYAHQSNRKNAVRIYDLAQIVAYRQRYNHPELTEFNAAIFFFLHDLLHHMMREEQVLFPNIKQLSKANKGSKAHQYSTFGLIKEWSGQMQKEHLSACRSLKLLNQLSGNYTIPPDACNAYKSLMGMMQEFEVSFLLLIDIENNILFPRALVEDGEPGWGYKTMPGD